VKCNVDEMYMTILSRSFHFQPHCSHSRQTLWEKHAHMLPYTIY